MSTVKKYDFLNPDFISAKGMVALESFFERFCSPLGFVFARHTRLQAAVHFTGTEILSFREYLGRLDNTCTYFECSPGSALTLGLEIIGLNNRGPKIAASSFWEGEELAQLVRNIFTALFKKRRSVLKNFRRANSPAGIQPANRLELLFMASYRLILSERSYKGPGTLVLNLIIPRYTLTRVFDRCFPPWRRLTPRGRQEFTTLQISAGPVQLPGTVLQRGDSLLLKRKMTDPLLLRDSQSGAVIAAGEPVILKKHLAVRIHAVNPREIPAAGPEVILGEVTLSTANLSRLKPGVVTKSNSPVHWLPLLSRKAGCVGFLEAAENNQGTQELRFRIVDPGE